MFSLNFACVIDSIPRTFTRRGVIFTHPTQGRKLVTETLTDAELLSSLDLVPLVETDKPEAKLRTQRVTGPSFNYTGSVVEKIYTASYLPLDSIKADFLRTSRELLIGYIADVNIDYTLEEIRTWDQQRAEAIAYIDDSLSDVPLLDAIADSRGITVSTLANDIVARSIAFSAEAGHILGRKQGIVDLLDAAETGEALDQILEDELYTGWLL